MKKNIIFASILIFSFIPAKSQLSLKACIDSAMNNHPRYQDFHLLGNIKDNNIDNIRSGWYPELLIKGQATYQSDVIEFNLEGPAPGLEFPTVPKDQYKIYLDLRQTLFDGGKSKNLRSIEETSYEATVIETQKEIDNVKDQVVQYYYGLLRMNKKQTILQLNLDLLRENRKIIRASIENGVALKSDLDMIDIEILEIQQELDNLKKKSQNLREILSTLTGIQLQESDSLKNTNFSHLPSKISRKEISLLDKNKELLETRLGLLEASRMPVAFAFAQAGYGKPGLNMLYNEFDTYYLVGIGLQWNIWDWGNKTREKNNLYYRADILENQKKFLKESIGRARSAQMSEIENHRGNIKKFGEILTLRENLSEIYRDQLNNGTVKTIDYLRVLDQEKLIRMKLESEKIMLQEALAKYMLISGEFKFE